MLKCDDETLHIVSKSLLSGKVGVIPTDTVYGLAAHPMFESAVSRLYSIKERQLHKPIALLCDSVESASRFLGTKIASFGAKYWPGALTVVGESEGVRIPDHEWTRELISLCGGALRVTSANISSCRPATDAAEALSSVGLSADFVVDGGVSPIAEASTVIKVSQSGRLETLRPGPIKPLVLASGSPRRAKILEESGVFFEIVKSNAKEVQYHDDPERTVMENALAKGSKGNVLSADTIVWFENRIYGKPKDETEAKDFLKRLSGKTHTVFTGVAYDGQVEVVKSNVKFRNLSDSEIDDYIRTVHPLDRAGAYDIDESGDKIVMSYTGSYENIMGLPIEPLKKWGIL
jgi:septum formation protein